MTNEAKFEKPVSAEDYAKAAMKRAKTQGSAYLDGIKKDAESANKVKQVPPADNGADEFMDAIKSVGQEAVREGKENEHGFDQADLYL